MQYLQPLACYLQPEKEMDQPGKGNLTIRLKLD